MDGADGAVVDRLHALYVDELEKVLVPPVHALVNERQGQALIRLARAAGPDMYKEPDEQTWIWSDLHLGHELSLGVFSRPFESVRDADKAMMDAWYDLVGSNETIVCLGDVSVDASVDADHQRWWREAPGTKWLVLGNHEADPVNQVRSIEADRTAVTLVAPGDPPLLLTHVPLLQVPVGWGERARARAREGVPDQEPARERQRRAV